LRSLKLTFSTKKKDFNTNKFAINWQNLARVQLQLKFAFILPPLENAENKETVTGSAEDYNISE